ncbi:MAG: universal stress protein, partial [Euryarchaeota archaeon]|nr:universal stress protein [Euryarchaeota archaeon]
EKVRATNADLVVAGSKGSGAWRRLLLGSVVDGIKNDAPASVLIAKSPPPLERILLATDGSPGSRSAALAALDLARKFKASLRVLHVVDLGGAKPTIRDPFGSQFPEASSPPWSDVEAKFEVRVGKPAEAIVAAAARAGADLIVMGCRGLSRLKSFTPGSVSNRVAHAARCSVLIVKAPW